MLVAAEFPNHLVIAHLPKVEVGDAEPWLLGCHNPMHRIAIPFDVAIAERKTSITEQVKAPRLDLPCALNDTFARPGQPALDFSGYDQSFVPAEKKIAEESLDGLRIEAEGDSFRGELPRRLAAGGATSRRGSGFLPGSWRQFAAPSLTDWPWPCHSTPSGLGCPGGTTPALSFLICLR